MKQLSGFTVLNVYGADRVAFTYDEIDEEGNLVSHNNKKSYYAVDEELKLHIEAIRDHIKTNKLEE